MLNFTVVNDHVYMSRCLELAAKGNGWVSPNPMVGAVLVYNNRVIGEGYHEYFGGPHAEVNCIRSVAQADVALIADSILYVSLEPCNHHGKTPPCTELIIQHQIKEVVVACTDPHSRVCGAGIKRLEEAGIKVRTGVMQEAAAELNFAFFHFHQQQRPYVKLKWAQTNDGFISDNNQQPLKISNPITDRQVHRWRATCDAIMVGTHTLIHDNPSLTTRLWPGKNPIRVAIDKQLKAPLDAHIFNNAAPTIIFNAVISEVKGNVTFIKLTEKESWTASILDSLFQKNIQSLLVEGGATLLQHFINEHLWDEASVITNTSLSAHQGTAAPVLQNASVVSTQNIRNDRIQIFRPLKK